MYTIEQIENIINLVNNGNSYESIGKIYGVSGSAIRSMLIKKGYDLPKKRLINNSETFNKGSILKSQVCHCLNCGKEFIKQPSSKKIYCNTSCQHEYEHKQKYERFKRGDEYFMRPNYNPHIFKNDILLEQGGVCAICGCKPEWNEKPLVFILDHIDGDASNNIRINMRCICPNCDSQLDTYKSKNKNGKRIYYRKGLRIHNN